MKSLEEPFATALRSAVSESSDPSLANLLRYACANVPEMFSELAPSANVEPGSTQAERIGRFVVEATLGQGGFGTVLRVYDPNLERRRALKVPNLWVLTSPLALAYFLDEAKKTAMIEHPNVVRVIDAAEVGPLCYILMEFCPEGSLADWLATRPADRPVPARWAASLLAEIADGVHQAHLSGLLHRDLKPSNVLLVRSGDSGLDDPPQFRPKVCDFGLAQALSAPDNTDDGAHGSGRAGTLPYMSPEQLRGTTAIRETSDIYALGAILYEILTGQKLYPGAGKEELRERILSDAPSPSARSIRPDLPREVDIICRTCLAKVALNRYATAAELAADLRRYLNEGWVRSSSRWRRARAYLLKRGTRIAAAALMLVLSGGAILWSVNARLANDAKSWLARLEASSTNVAALPGLLKDHDPRDPLVAGRLQELFESGNPGERLVASAALAPWNRQAADFVYAQLLTVPAVEVVPLVRTLEGQVRDLADRLNRDVQAGEQPPSADEDAIDVYARRRANAATALIALGQSRNAFRLLAFTPKPDARTALIHTLGPAGIGGKILHEQLLSESDTTVRRGLIQALGEVPDRSWSSAEKQAVVQTLLQLYTDDKDSGVHGSAKWLLRRWGKQSELKAIDADLGRSREYRQGFGWRIGPLGLTFVKVAHPESGRVIEVTDTEVPKEIFLSKMPHHTFRHDDSPDLECPILGTSFIIAAQFCNEVSDADGIDESQFCFGPATQRDIKGFPNAMDREGYRLPTDREFEFICRAGVSCRRYSGDSARFLRSYVWYKNPPARDRAYPVGSLKPNDFGLFDTLGNVSEVCQAAQVPAANRNRAIYCGGSVINHASQIAIDLPVVPTLVNAPDHAYTVGFRVARTIPKHR